MVFSTISHTFANKILQMLIKQHYNGTSYTNTNGQITTRPHHAAIQHKYAIARQRI